MTKIGDIAKVRNGYAFASEDFRVSGVPVIRMSDLKEFYVETANAMRVPQKYWDELKLFRIVKGNLIVGMSVSVGKIAIYNSDEPALQNQRIGVFQIRDTTKLDADYLKYFAFTLEDRLLALSRGVAVQNISATEIESIEIPLPPLDEQKRIAAILEEADHARRTRRFTQSLSDTFLQEVFVDMFGDPVTNPMGWAEYRLQELSELVTDGEHATPQRSEHGIKLLSARNVQNGYLDYAVGLDFVPEHEFERIRKRIEPQVGDVLMSCSGTVGRVTTIHVYEPMAMVRSVALIRPRMDKIEPLFLEHFLRSERGQQLIKIGTNTSSQGNIFQNQISKLLIQLPPLPLQRKFVEIVQQEHKMKFQQHESARQGEHLFQTLLHRAFRGEL